MCDFWNYPLQFHFASCFPEVSQADNQYVWNGRTQSETGRYYLNLTNNKHSLSFSVAKWFATLHPNEHDPDLIDLVPWSTCVFIFMSEQRAALLEDLVTQVAGVHPTLRFPHFLPGRGGVWVVQLFHGGHTLWAGVLTLLLNNKYQYMRIYNL